MAGKVKCLDSASPRTRLIQLMTSTLSSLHPVNTGMLFILILATFSSAPYAATGTLVTGWSSLMLVSRVWLALVAAKTRRAIAASASMRAITSSCPAAPTLCMCRFLRSNAVRSPIAVGNPALSGSAINCLSPPNAAGGSAMLQNHHWGELCNQVKLYSYLRIQLTK